MWGKNKTYQIAQLLLDLLAERASGELGFTKLYQAIQIGLIPNKYGYFTLYCFIAIYQELR
jgi:hypothetical protein